MFRVLFALLRARVLLGLAVLAAAAFLAALGVAVVGELLAAQVPGGGETNSPAVDRIVVPVGVLVTLIVVGVVVASVARRRAKARRSVPLYRAMLRDADTIPYTFLAQIHTRPEPATGGQVNATDLRTGGCGPLWLPGHTFPAAAVVCFTCTADGPRIRAWMTGRLWRGCARKVSRADKRAARTAARGAHDTQRVTEQQIREAARQAVTAAEDILREHNRR